MMSSISSTILVNLYLLFFSTCQLVPESSSLRVSGTSSLHDWDMAVEKFTMSAVRESDALKQVKFSAEVFSIKSGKSIMDNKTYDALLAKKYRTISFNAKQLELTNGQVRGQGQVKVAGVTKSLNVQLNYREEAAGKLKLTGQVPLKMSDFGIDPPTAMFGTLTTGDAVTVHLDLTLTSQQ